MNEFNQRKLEYVKHYCKGKLVLSHEWFTTDGEGFSEADIQTTNSSARANMCGDDDPF